MLWLKKHTTRIQELIEEGSAESLTLAALQCRLSIEKFCYERLRNAHEYISADDLKRWQPRDVVNQLIQEVDPYIASEFTVSVSKGPVEDEDPELSQAIFEANEFVEVGRQVGFDPKQLGKLWNGLGSYLHVRMPKGRDAAVAFFSEPENIKRKVLEALAELQRLEKGTLIGSGFRDPSTVTFECNCGSKNKRRAVHLKHGQTISCMSPQCSERYTVHLEGDEFTFEARSLKVACQSCAVECRFPEKSLTDLPKDQTIRFLCSQCGAENLVQWRLVQLKPPVEAN